MTYSLWTRDGYLEDAGDLYAAPKLKRSSGCEVHDWIDFERHPDRLYRCRMCDVIGQRAMTIVQAITCDQCHRGATVGQRGQNGKVAWFCEVHRS